MSKYLPDAFGINNLKGNMCYFSSLVQAMLGCPTITNKSPQLQKIFDEHNKDPTHNGRLVVEFLDSFAKKIESSASHGIGSTQACAHECLTFLLDDELQKLFKSEYHYIFQCQKCKHITERDAEEYYMDISPKHDFNAQIIQSLDKIDYNCEEDNCNSVTSLREILIKKPPVIYITLVQEIKDIPVFLKIDKYDYKLMSYIDHFGSFNGGHYTCNSVRKNGEYHFNDGSIRTAPLRPNLNTFMLFYHICDIS